MHSSNENRILGAMLPSLSLPAARILFSCFPSTIFTTKSPGLFCSPTIIPAYTSSPGSTKNLPLSCSFSMEYAVV